MEERELLEVSAETHGRIPGAVLMRLSGKLGGSEVRRFHSEVSRVLDGGIKTIDVDLEGVSYIDSAGIAEMVPIHQTVRAHGADLKISNPRRLIRHILLSAHLNDIFEIGEAADPRGS